MREHTLSPQCQRNILTDALIHIPQGFSGKLLVDYIVIVQYDLYAERGLDRRHGVHGICADALSCTLHWVFISL